MHFRVLLALSFVSALTCGQDWTRFRGPGGLGLASGATIPASFGADDLNWKIKLPGKGHSSPLVWKDRVFVTCEGAESGKRLVVCIDAKSGSVVWKRERGFSVHPQHRFNSVASATPAVDADRIYLLWTSGDTLVAAALNHDGKQLWKRDVGPFSAQHGSGISPVVVGDVVVIGNDNEKKPSFLMGLDRATGATRWKRERESSRASYATPLVRRVGKRVEVIFASTSHGVTSLDPKTGALQWETGPVFTERCVGAPAIADGVLFACAGTGGGGRESLAIELPVGKSTMKPKKLYTVRRSLSYVPGPIGVGKRFFMFSDGGIVTCLHASSGERVWRERLDGAFYCSPICIGDRLYAVSRSGELFVISTGDTFKLLGRVDLGERSSATPAVANGVLYLRTERHLLSVGGKPDCLGDRGAFRSLRTAHGPRSAPPCGCGPGCERVGE